MNISLVRDILNRSIAQKKLYAFHQYGESNYYCGYVLSYNTNTVQIRHFTKYGEPDGTISINFDNIKNISIQGKYLTDLEFLIEHRVKFLALEDSSTETLIPTSEGFKNVLRSYVNDRKIILNLEILGSHHIGFIDEVKEPYIIFTEIDNSGNIIETMIHNLNDISAIRVNDKMGRKALFLYNFGNNRK